MFVNNTNDQEQIVRGMLYFAVLSLLEKEENYGARLLLLLEPTPFKTRAGTLYPLLTRMQKQKLITSRWVIKDGKPPMRYYEITETGFQKLKKLRLFMQDIMHVLEGRIMQ